MTQPQTNRARTGFTLLEVSVAGVLLAVAMIVTVQVVGWLAVERRSADRRRSASLEAANVMERLTARSWAELTQEKIESVGLSPEARQTLPEAELKLRVTADARDAGVKRLSVEVHWRNRAGVLEPPVRLAAWVYRREGAAP